MNCLKKHEKLGEGTYGIVYKAEDYITGNSVALKRNLTDTNVFGFGNLREMDILVRVSHHPFFVKIIRGCTTEQLINTPFSPFLTSDTVNINRKGMKNDKIHFILECVPIKAPLFFRNETECTPEIGKILSCQLLLAIEYMHSQNISHRDLKPDNLLIDRDVNNSFTLKICDFGMSQFMSYYPSTRGISTSWYRAPEICCKCTYGKEIDMWSIGCIIFEIFGKSPFIYDIPDNDELLFNHILNRMPTEPNEKIMKRFKKHGIKLKPEAYPPHRDSFFDQLNMSFEYINSFDQTLGTIDQLIDLLSKLLELDPMLRLTASQALDHPFFDYTREYINGIRKEYPPILERLPNIKIINCKERRWMVETAFEIYNNRKNPKIIKWYSHQILFHAMDIYDRYIEWVFLPENIEYLSFEEESEENGKICNHYYATLLFYVCLYYFKKYYNDWIGGITWDNIIPEVYKTEEAYIFAENFEIFLINIFEYKSHYYTLLEINNANENENNSEIIKKLLIGYGNIRNWNQGSVRKLYEYIIKNSTEKIVTESKI